MVLVIEDDDDLRETLCAVLNAEGYLTAAAPNGQAALELLETGELPALIILDLMMPVMNGWGFRERQLADSRIASIPVLVMTAASGLDESVISATNFARKPIEIGELLDRVARCLSGDFDNAPKTVPNGVVVADLDTSDSPRPS